jgi:hypothetical protein
LFLEEKGEIFIPVKLENVPKKRLYTGAEIPAIGLGTFGSDNYDSTANESHVGRSNKINAARFVDYTS